MKKAIIILAITTLIFSSCNKKKSTESEVSPTPSSSVTETEKTPEASPEKTPATSGSAEEKEQPSPTPVGAEKAIEDLKKDVDGNMEGEGIYMAPTSEDFIVIMEKGEGNKPEINRYLVADGVDMSELEEMQSIKFKFKVIDGTNTIVSYEAGTNFN